MSLTVTDSDDILPIKKLITTIPINMHILPHLSLLSIFPFFFLIKFNFWILSFCNSCIWFSEISKPIATQDFQREGQSAFRVNTRRYDTVFLWFHVLRP